MDELLAQFLIEGPEMVQQGVDALLALERRPGDRALVDDAFRAVHTLKGSVGLFDLPAMAEVLHAAEDVLGAIRDGQRAIDRVVIGGLLTALDQTQIWLDALETGGALPEDAASRSGRVVGALMAAGESHEAPDIAARRDTPDWARFMADALPADLRDAGLVVLRYEPDAGCFFAGDDPMAILAQTPGLIHLALSLRSGAADGEPYDPFTCDLVIEAASTAPLTEVKGAFRFVPGQVRFAHLAARASGADPTDASSRTLRVDSSRVEALATLVDELVAANTGLAGLAALARDGAESRELAASLTAQSAAIDRLVGLAHQKVMALRMAPVRPLLRRFPRVVRDMGQSLGKHVELTVEGGGVEADRAIVEGLFEPLTHLLRNAVDHGIESPEGRLRAGKPAEATIILSAHERSGRLQVAVRDDGRGIDVEAIRQTAAQRGLADEEALAAMDDGQVIDLIFMPGFSTAGAVTALSGRGVGMDAIRAAVQRLGGRIAVTTAWGQGTTVELSLPLTVSLTKVMVVSHRAERYGMPMDGVLETLRLRADQVIPIRAGHAFNWRDRAVPLFPLSSLTGGLAALTDGDLRVLVVRAGAQAVGLAIDAIEQRLDVAMRPLDGLLAGMPGLAGATVLGDGQILMILDPEALIG